ncbi:MAG: hypothetical protein RLY14_2287 [Planctomycetota bacterium]|jgi:hypothetical protein
MIQQTRSLVDARIKTMWLNDISGFEPANDQPDPKSAQTKSIGVEFLNEH